MSSTFFMSHSRFQHHPLLAIYCKGLSNCVSLICQVNPLNSQTYMAQILDSWRQQMKIGYLTATSRTTGSFRKLGPVMHGMHGLTVFGYVMMPANLVPSNRLNSSTALGSQNPDRNSKRRNSDINLDGTASWALACNHYRRC